MSSVLEGFLEWLIEYYGVLGVFLVSFISNCIPYSTVPYLFFVMIYAGTVKSVATLLLITIAGGLGAALGKLVVYYMARGARRVLPDNVREHMELFAQYAGRNLFYAVLVFAVLPLPDDILYVPLGLSRYSVAKFFTALAIGKIFITGLTVFLGAAIGYQLETSSSPVFSIPILVLITVILTYLVIKIDWIDITRKAREKGRLYALAYLIYQALKILFIDTAKPLLKRFKRK